METKMSFDEQINYINSKGNIKELVKDTNFLREIIVGDKDRHLLLTFINMINNGIETGELTTSDLSVLQTGYLMKQVISLPALVEGKRKLFNYELGDKLNYLTSIKDIDTLNAMFSNDTLIELMIKHPNNQELNYWFNNKEMYYNLPCETKISIGLSFIKNGGQPKGILLIDNALKTMKNERIDSNINKKGLK